MNGTRLAGSVRCQAKVSSALAAPPASAIFSAIHHEHLCVAREDAEHEQVASAVSPKHGRDSQDPEQRQLAGASEDEREPGVRHAQRRRQDALVQNNKEQVRANGRGGLAEGGDEREECVPAAANRIKSNQDVRWTQSNAQLSILCSNQIKCS